MRSKLNPGDLIRIKKHCKIGGQYGIIVSYRDDVYSIFMQTGRVIEALGMNIEVASES